MHNSSNISLELQMKELLKEYQDEITIKMESALTESGQLLVSKLKSASPRSNGLNDKHLQDSWDQKLEYKGVRYVGNTKTVVRPKLLSNQKGGIPLSSLLEFGSNGRPFIQNTFNATQNEITALIARKIGG